MAELPQYVPDASVVGLWYLKDQQSFDQAQAVFRDWVEGRIALFAPSHLMYEVPSAIVKAVGGGHLRSEVARRQVSLFWSHDLPVVHAQDLIDQGVETAIRLGCTLYDGTYLALAELLECPMVHADTRLRRTLTGKISRALWIEDYQPSGQL